MLTKSKYNNKMLRIKPILFLIIINQIIAQKAIVASTSPNTTETNRMSASSKIEMTESSEQNAKLHNDYEFTNKMAINYIWPTIPIGFLILGTISNILSILVFLRREMIKFSSFWYFAVLNAINLAVLYVTLGRVILNYNLKTDLREINLFACKLHVFLTYFLGHLSSLLLCMISIDRVVSVMFLHKAKSFCTPKVALACTIILILFNFLLSSHILIFESGYYKPINNSNGSIAYVVNCQARNGTVYDTFLQQTWKLIDMSIFAFIPFIIMLTCSVIIIVRVAQQSKKFEKRGNKSNRGSRKECKENENDDPQINKTNKSKTEVKFSTRTRNLAIMLIPVNILFLIFLSPVVITIYVYENLSKDELTLAIVELLSYCNFTFNFIIYFLTSSKFREEFYRLVNEDLLPRLGINRSTNLAPRASFKNNTNVAKNRKEKKEKENIKTMTNAKYMKIDQNVQIN